MLLSFSAILAGLTGDSDDDVNRTAAFGFGVTAVPFVFIALAFSSRHRRAPTAVLKSLGIWVTVSAAVGLISLVLALYLGFGIAGIFSLRSDEAHNWRSRMTALSIGLVYTVVLVVISPALGLFGASTVPLIALGFGEEIAERREAAAG